MILIAKVKMVKIWIVHVIKNPQCWIFLAKSKVYESFDSWYRKSQDLYVMKKIRIFTVKLKSVHTQNARISKASFSLKVCRTKSTR